MSTLEQGNASSERALRPEAIEPREALRQQASALVWRN